MRETARLAAGCLVACLIGSSLAAEAAQRQTISLDGTWQIAEGTMEKIPAEFSHQVPVPGLADMAAPAFAEVGTDKSNAHRQAFWYHRTFTLDGSIPAVAVLNIHKAMFGCRVILNGIPLGEHRGSFTQALFDARPALRRGENELVIRVAASRDAVSKVGRSGGAIRRNLYVPGIDAEKKLEIPGIYDSLELILSGSPHIVRVQAVPDIEHNAVTVCAWVRRVGSAAAANVHVTLREVSGKRVVGEGDLDAAGGEGPERTGRVTIPIRDCRLWSPEDPFLYELEARTDADAVTTRFGMRSFRFDPASGRAILNGRPYFMRGSNVCIFRFMEDSQRGDKPWREEWVRRLHRKFRSDMDWNCLRYCIGFPPEMWYRIADEEGILIQDEYPLWTGGLGKYAGKLKSPRLLALESEDLDADELAEEFTEWMEERWNHPCVVLWDACNETDTPQTGAAIRKVRGLDLSHRPWDNGYGPAMDPGDSAERHGYHFGSFNRRLQNIVRDPGTAGWAPGKNAVVLNEYGGLWLNRDGTPTVVTRATYDTLLGPGATAAQRQHLYARYMAAETEFWRCRRACAAVIHFCGLGYSRPDGATSDHWLDLEKLTWEPEFYRYVRDAFAPVGLMIDAFAEEYPAGPDRRFPVIVVNDLDRDWKGTVRFRLLHESKTIEEKTLLCEVAALGSRKLVFAVDIPASPAHYQLEAALLRGSDRPIRSLRDFGVLTVEEREARFGVAVGEPVKASSVVANGSAEHAVDGNPKTSWRSAPSDPQWIAVDLQKVRRIGRVVLEWQEMPAKEFSIEVSPDGTSWHEVYRAGCRPIRGEEEAVFAPVDARWVRMIGRQRGTDGKGTKTNGYALWELLVFQR
jgi:hypothetical protein